MSRRAAPALSFVARPHSPLRFCGRVGCGPPDDFRGLAHAVRPRCCSKVNRIRGTKGGPKEGDLNIGPHEGSNM